MPTRIVIGGPANCGKSTLTASLYRQLQNLGVSVGIHELDVYSDTHSCILGLKPWEKRKKRKRAWFNPTISRQILGFANDEREIVIGDLPGKVESHYLDEIVAPADQAIVVAKDWAGLVEWQEFFERQKLPVFLKVISHLGQLPMIPPHVDAVYVQGLCRQIHLNGEVRSVAERIAQFCREPVLATG